MSFKPTDQFRAVRAAKRDRAAAEHGPHSQPVIHDLRPARPVPSEALQPLPASGGDGLVELLWHERRVESFGLTHRLAIPLAGRRFRGEPTVLATVLGDWWSQPGHLSNGSEVTFVSAELVEAPLTPAELVLTITTAQPAGEAQIANLRTIRDLRRALRDVRRGAFAVKPGGLALV